jgi:hypothetical protein
VEDCYVLPCGWAPKHVAGCRLPVRRIKCNRLHMLQLCAELCLLLNSLHMPATVTADCFYDRCTVGRCYGRRVGVVEPGV